MFCTRAGLVATRPLAAPRAADSCSESLLKRFERSDLSQPGPAGYAEIREVRFQDVDAAGVIFYARGFEYLHDAYVAFLARSGIVLPKILEQQEWAAPISHAEIDYFRPLRFGDRIEVALVRSYLEKSAVTIGYRISEVESGAVAAVGQTVHNFIDVQRFQRVPVPAAVARAFEALSEVDRS